MMQRVMPRGGLSRLAVLISGNGSNLQAILDACAAGEIPAEVVVVAANKGDAYGLQRARKAGVAILVKEKVPGQARTEYDAGLAREIQAFAPDWVVLAGWMRILTASFLNAFPKRVINLHPALPGTFPGTDAIRRAYDAFQLGSIQHTGVMVHLVPDEGVDSGPVLLSEVLDIRKEDTLESLEGRMHELEHRLLVQTIKQLVAPG